MAGGKSRHLIPGFITRQYQRHAWKGKFHAAAMFVDISGFTRLTEALMQYEKDGAEILTNLLNTVFNPIVHQIYQHGGMISTFAGDAFTALFPVRRKDAHLHALQSAFFVNRFFADNKTVQTKYGDFTIGVKIGLSYGQAEWGILGNSGRHTYYFRGPAVDGCARAEHHAKKGDIVADDVLFHLVEDYVEAYPVRKNATAWKLTSTTLDLPAKRVYARKPDKSVLKAFIPDAVIELRETAEFRNICSVFISFEAPEDHETLDRFVSEVIQRVSDFGAYFNKIDFGDKGAVLVIAFGAPIAFENNLKRALDFVLAFKSSARLKWRAGLAYGLVYAGLIGGRDRCEYTAIGDIVNQSAFYMTQADWGDIWISQRIHHSSEKHFRTVFADALRVKGSSESVPVFTLLSAREKSVPRLYQDDMVGRQKELEKLRKYAGPIFMNRFAGIVYVHGEAGVGKSRLAAEFRGQLGDKVNWFCCPAENILREAFHPFRYFLLHYFQQSVQATEGENKDRFNQIFDRLIENLSTVKQTDQDFKNELLRTHSILGAQVGLLWQGSLWEQLDAKGKYENTRYAIKTLLAAESLIKPVVLELEDLHWFDKDSASLLPVITRNIPDCPILILATSRYRDDGGRPTFHLGKAVTQHEIQLHGLSEPGVRNYAENRLGGPISDALYRILHEKTRGNPFFLEQMLQLAIDSGYLEYKQNRWFLTATMGGQLPDTINAMLIARVDRLSNEVKRVVKAAAVIGREFEVRLLSRVLKESVAEEVKLAEQNRIWQELKELQYIFKHALMREAVYDMQLRARLFELHQLTAEAIETLYADDLSLHYGDLAYHYSTARNVNKAKEYLARAGYNANINYHNQDALNYYDQLLTYLDDDAEKVDILLKKGTVLERVGRWDESQNSFEDALSIAENTRNDHDIAAANRLLGALSLSRNLYEKASAYLKKALTISEKVGDRQLFSRTIGNMGLFYSCKGKYDDAIACHRRQLKIAEELGAKLDVSAAIGHVGLVLSERGDYEAAMVCFNKKLKIAEELGQKREISAAIGNIGIVYHCQSELDRAIACYERMLTIAEELGNKWFVSMALGNMGLAYNEKSSYDAALACFEKKLKIAEELNAPNSISSAIGGMGSVHANKGNFEAAATCYGRQLKISEELGDQAGIAIAVGNMGLAYVALGDYDAAMACYDRQLEIDDELGHKRGTSIVLGNMGEVYALKGEYALAMDFYEKSLRISEELGFKRNISIVICNMGAVCREKSDYKAALNCFDRSISIGQELGIKYHLCFYLIEKARTLYLMQETFSSQVETLNEARDINEQGLQIAQEIERKDMLFQGKVLRAQIDVADGQAAKAVDSLSKMLRAAESKTELSALHYVLWKTLSRKQLPSREHQQTALALYRELYAKTPAYEYKKRMDELSVRD